MKLIKRLKLFFDKELKTHAAAYAFVFYPLEDGGKIDTIAAMIERQLQLVISECFLYSRRYVSLDKLSVYCHTIGCANDRWAVGWKVTSVRHPFLFKYWVQEQRIVTVAADITRVKEVVKKKLMALKLVNEGTQE